jgi:hypothetical protein
VEICEYFHTFLHSFTFVALDDKGVECETCFIIMHLRVEPGWRNWQTQRTQNPPTFGSWGFDSPSRHQLKTHRISGLLGLALSMDGISSADAADFSPTFNERC